MKKLICAAMALALLSGTAAFAQRGNDNRDSRDNRGHDVRDMPHWSRGDRLPTQYRGNRNQYVVTDWRSHHLRRPPRGYNWVRVDNRYALVGITSGLIASIILGGQ